MAGRSRCFPGCSQPRSFPRSCMRSPTKCSTVATVEPLTTKQVRETEAEAVAFVVCQSVGLQNGTASQDYIQLWHGDANLLRESLEAVQQTAAVILGGEDEIAHNIEQPIISRVMTQQPRSTDTVRIPGRLRFRQIIS